MATWDDILRDETRFPDTMPVSLEGQSYTLGDLRGMVKGRQSDLTKREQRAAQKEEWLRQQEETFRQATARYGRTGDEPPDDGGRPAPAGSPDNPWWQRPDPQVEADAYWGPMVRWMRGVDQTVRELQNVAKTYGEAYTKDREEQSAQRHLETLAGLKKADPEMNEVEVVQFARTFGLRDLRMAYNLMTRDKAIEAARAKGREDGIALGKTEALKTPPIPMGLRVMGAPPKPDSLPKSLDQMSEMAQGDPDIIEAYNKGIAGEQI